MKKILMTMALAATLACGAAAQNVNGLGVYNIDVQRPTDTRLRVSMEVNPKNCHVTYTRSVEITPVIRANEGSLEKRLPSVTIAGKNAYYYNLREDGTPNLLKSGSDKVMNYQTDVDYEPWMEHSQLALDVRDTGCCGAEKAPENYVPVANLDYAKPSFNPVLEYVEPKAVASKLFNIQGRAFINFPVNKTEIYPDYMTNPEELKKVLGTIDVVRDNKDAKVKKIKLTGYASPEGPYANNVRLAQGRTEALREYVRKQYAFPENLFETTSVPEDWSGLREAVAKSELADAKAIVEFIDSDYPIEKRNDRLRALFPETYPFLLKNIYPGLRHTDYVITYEVRKYTDINEIREVLKKRPQNLSLNEFFLAANSYKPGSPEYNEVFDVAVRMYPDDPVANINAAMSAINRGDLTSAEQFLSRVGKNSEANYARGILAAKKGDYTLAKKYLKASSNPKANDALNQIERIENYKGAVTYIN